MIKASEIRIGNWFIGYDNKPFKFGLYEFGLLENNHCELDEIIREGVKLTTSILEKAGFLKEDWSYIFPFNGGNTAYSIEQYGSKFGFCYSGQVTKETWVEYLHQLQNLYHSLTGEELEIKNPV